MKFIDVSELPEISSRIKTFWGEKLDGNSDVWELNDIGVKTQIHFNKYKNKYIRYLVKLFLSNLAYSKSLSHLQNFERILFLMASIDSYNLEDDLKKFMNELIIKHRNQKQEYIIWYLKTWYIWCSDLDLMYFDSDFADTLGNLSIAGNIKGQVVMSLDQNEGPFNDFELSTIVNYLKKDEEISFGKLLAYLFLTLGTNPRNLLLLKWKDLSVLKSEGYSIYLLDVPRIKKRTQIGTRKEFKTRELDRRVGDIFEQLKEGKDLEQFVFLDSNGKPFTTINLRTFLIRYLKKILASSPISEINITPRRFRYTFATKLVMSGVSKERLADLLDHSDLQNVHIYYDLRHKIKGFLNEAENKVLGDILRRFDGTILEDSEGIKKDIKYIGKRSTLNLGKCGSNSLCELNPPYSCIICSKFNAFNDELETYKRFYSDLLTWKKERIKKLNQNDRIKDQMDEIISALRDLISRIEAMQ